MGEQLPIAIPIIASLMEKEKTKLEGKQKKGFDTGNQGIMLFFLG